MDDQKNEEISFYAVVACSDGNHGNADVLRRLCKYERNPDGSELVLAEVGDVEAVTMSLRELTEAYRAVEDFLEANPQFTRFHADLPRYNHLSGVGVMLLNSCLTNPAEPGSAYVTCYLIITG